MEDEFINAISGSHLLNQISTAVIGIDFEGNVLVWNEGATKLYGLSFAEMMGKPLSDSHAYEYVDGDTEASVLLRIKSEGSW